MDFEGCCDPIFGYGDEEDHELEAGFLRALLDMLDLRIERVADRAWVIWKMTSGGWIRVGAIGAEDEPIVKEVFDELERGEGKGKGKGSGEGTDG